MLGMFHLLPLLKGWEYKAHTLERTVIRGAEPVELPLAETGWLLSFDLVSDDCYGTLTIEFQGADLQIATATVNAEFGFAMFGAVSADPAGYVSKYFRPDPASTAGIFACSHPSGYAGAPLPYLPTIKIKASLPVQSTQQSATVAAVAGCIAITDKKAFMLSLRQLLGIKGRIPKELLIIGPVKLEED